MPTSSYENMQIFLRAIRHFSDEIDSMLDVGVGFGKYGVLSREYLDVWNGRYKKSSWKTKIHGVEIFKKYKNPIHKFVYDKVYYENISSFSIKMQTYDVVSMVDAIEHLDKKTGADLIERFLGKVKVFLYLAFPDGNRDDALCQGTVFGNRHEAHVSRWTGDEFRKMEEALVVSNTQVLLFPNLDMKKRFAATL